jgi:ABC-type phosphate/phosphonate transport system substrate-binding protein
MESLRVTSCMAENADFICRQITQYIAERLKIAAEFINDIPWQERERLLDAEQIHVCWICGLPYVWKADQPVSRIELLAAPVMSGERYRNRPIYFSDVVVHRESDIKTFADLRGASWVYNESRSHSGFNLVRYHLAMRGETWGYFGRVRASGAHQKSLQMILHHKADASAIDSTVLEMECRRRPWLLSSIRVIETLGPSPIPPWVIQKNLPREIRRELRELLPQMHTDPAGIRILTAGAIARFVAVEETAYDTIRGMARQAEQVVSWPE